MKRTPVSKLGCLKCNVYRYFLFGVEFEKMMEKLWGDNFFDPKTKKWTKKDTGEKSCMRAFVQFCYEPIRRVIDAAMNDNKDKLWPMLEKLKVGGLIRQVEVS
jgi:elongation factor 2